MQEGASFPNHGKANVIRVHVISMNVARWPTAAVYRLRELRILRYLDSTFIIKIQTILKPLNREKFDELYVVFEYMETDLAQIIRSSQIVREEHVQVKIELGLLWYNATDFSISPTSCSAHLNTFTAAKWCTETLSPEISSSIGSN